MSRVRRAATGFLRSGAAPAVFDQGVVSATSFFSAVLIGRLLGVRGFGVFVLGSSILALSTEVHSSLVATPMMIRGPSLSERGLKRFHGRAILQSLGLGLAAAVALSCTAALLVLAGAVSREIGMMLGALGSALPFVLLREYLRRVFFLAKTLRPAIVLDVGVGLIQIAGLATLGVIGALSASHAYLMIACATAVSSAAVLWVLRAQFSFSTRGLAAHLGYGWKIGSWVLASGLLWSFGMQFYPWILAAMDGPEASGIWGACVGVTALGTIPMMGIQNVLGPKLSTALARGGGPGLSSTVARSEVRFPLMMCVPLIVLALLGDPLLRTLYGEQFGGHGWEVTIIAAGLVPAAAAFVYSRALFALERADLDFKVNFVPLGVLLTGGIGLVGWLGPLGAALSLLVSHAASAVVRRVGLHRAQRQGA